MSFLAPLVSDNSKSLEKFELGALSSTATPKVKHFCTRTEFLFVAYMCVIFDLPNIINFRDMNGFYPNWGPEPLLNVTLEGPE